MRRLRNTLAALAIVVGIAACASGDPRPEQPATYVTVNNQSRYDMTIYVVRDSGQRIRIGRVSSVSQERMQVPPYLMFGITSLRFLADPLAGRGSPISNTIAVTPGETIHLTIPSM